MSFLYWIVFGLIVGAVAKLLTPGRDPGGCLITMLLGMVGAFVGGFIGQALGFYGPDEPVGIVLAVVGAILVLLVYRAVARPAV
jgi:uncharacterized membrane protein YeaQ/YmgE (transglycosylase-associated protein family)